MIRCWCATAIATTSLSLSAVVVADTPGSQVAQVLAAEDAYVAAEVARDKAALERLVDDRFVLNQSDGTTSDKAALIDAVLGMNMVGQTITERSVLLEGDVAIVFGTAELRFAPSQPGGEASSSLLRYTATYVRREGTWRMLALQMMKRT